MKKIFSYFLWLVVLFLSLNLVWIALQYMSFDQEHNFLKLKQDMLYNPIWKSAFYIHLAFGITAILSGFPLFFNSVVKFKSSLHKQLGKIYIVSILFLTGPTGFYLSFYAEGGAPASVGFLLMSGLWMYITYMAFVKIVKEKDISAHYKWMIRSFCFTLSGITLRLLTPLGTHVFLLDAQTIFIGTAYASWMINLIIGEIIVVVYRNRIKNIGKLIVN